MYNTPPTEVERWDCHGHTCKITLVRGAHYCGYVKTELPESLTIDDLNEQYDIRVHGGLTYGVDADGWVGFDCAHFGDICVDADGQRLDVQAFGMPLVDPGDRFASIWPVERVKAETNRLADQLIAIETARESDTEPGRR